jgi:4-amino-4-deoxy-L-arabinose transferase-like glycosyltransferase
VLAAVGARVISPRGRRILQHPAVGALLAFAFGVVLRVEYSLHIHPPEAFISSDMELYVDLARRMAASGGQLMPWDVMHPLGYPGLLAFLISGGGSLARAANVQIVVSCLVPLAVGWLGFAAFGVRTALAAVAFASLYFPFIEYGALFLSEIHMTLWLAVAFAALFSARNAHRPSAQLLFSALAGVALSIAASFKAVALLVGATFFLVDAVALFLAQRQSPGTWPRSAVRWLARVGVSAAGAAPLLAVLARVCTRANRGNFCMLGKMGADFLLGHYGRIEGMEWTPDEGHGIWFGSPGAFLRHYEGRPHVPFTIMDNAANRAEAWRWIFAHPFEALVLSLDHIYDLLFGVAMWPSYGLPSWTWAHLSQYVFIGFLFIPTVLACALVLRRGWRRFLCSRTLLVLSPVLGLAFTVAMATGEVRYRIPFDVFFIVLACALVTRDLARVDAAPGPAPMVRARAAPPDAE